MQHVIQAVELARGFDGQDVVRLFDHADGRRGRDAGSRQYGHSSPSLMLLQSAQMPRLSLTSISAADSRAASSRGARRTWNASRCADFWPMPGRRLNSSIRRCSGSAKSGITGVRTAREAGPCRPACRPSSSASPRPLFWSASLQAAITMSCSISTSPATSGSIFTRGDVLVAVHLHGHHAAAGGGFDADQRDLLLHLLLHLLGLLHHGLHVSRHLHDLILPEISDGAHLAVRERFPGIAALPDAIARAQLTSSSVLGRRA